MTARFEVIAAADAPHRVLLPGQGYGRNRLADGEWGVVVGDPGVTALVLTGHRETILAYLDAVRVELAGTPEPTARPVCGELDDTTPSPSVDATDTERSGRAFVTPAYAGELGERYRDAADTAVMNAIEHGYEHDTARVVATLRALLDEDDSH